MMKRDSYSPVQPSRFDRVEGAELAGLLKEIVFLERDVESAKIDLALKSDFNLLDAFRMFDTKAYSYVSSQDMVDGLRCSLGFAEFVPDDIYLFFRRFDKTGRGRINFSEFSESVLPFSQEYAGLVTDRPDYYIRRGVDVSRFFNCDTRVEFQAFWRAYVKAERAVEHLRELINKRPCFNLRDGFAYCDKDGDGFLRPNELREVLADNGFYATERELAGLMHRLDADKDNRISFTEF